MVGGSPLVGDRTTSATCSSYDLRLRRVSTRQHNEPAGYQDAWHHHVHVFPRYPGDNLYNTRYLPIPATRAEREPYAHKLRRHFGSAPPSGGC